MSILNDTTWPARITRCIDRAHDKARSDENRYNGAYNTLLTYCFPVEEWAYVVSPEPGSCGPVNFVVYCVLDQAQDEDWPVLIVTIQVQDEADSQRADDQIRRRFDALLAQRTCPIPVLYGISILGTKMHVYRGVVATGEVAPADAPQPADFLADQWGVDVRSQEAFDMVKGIVKDIRDEVAKL